MDLRAFSPEHIPQAQQLALEEYRQARRALPALPPVDALPDLSPFAENALGIAALDGQTLVGFLCCYPPKDGVFTSNARGVFSPIHAHACTGPNRGKLYQLMYQAAGALWARAGCSSHSIALYAGDTEAQQAFFTYGFGLRCVDAMRPLEPIAGADDPALTFAQLTGEDLHRITPLRQALDQHLGQSPCFMYSSPAAFEAWLARALARPTQVFAALAGDSPMAFIEIAQGGENFASDAPGTANICGAYCLPQHRGRGILPALLNHAIGQLQNQGYARLGVDYESINPTAQFFWPKYFTPYTHSLVRRIDESALCLPNL